MWQNIQSAPRDGTIIEIKCSYGVAPWYSLMRWEKDGWRNPANGSGVVDESSLTWRLTTQTPENYTDPTGGFQDDPAYWRIACGLPFAGDERKARNWGKSKRWWEFWK